MIVGILFLVQQKWDLFDIKLLNTDGSQVELFDKDPNQVETDTAMQDSGEGVKEQSYVEIYLPSGLRIKVNVDVVDNDADRALGLSGRRYLGDYDGMLFVFDTSVNNPFWMKDMVIPIDILFVDSKGYIVDIKADQQICTDTYCPRIYSNESYQYVLEVNSGFCEKNNIEIGYSMVQSLN